MMGGQISVSSELGKGSTFTFRIPAEETAAPVGMQLTAASSASPETSFAPGRILVADDNAVNRKLISALLEQDGHKVKVVESGSAAVEALKNALFDAVLMDIQMPEMDGFEATRLIREMSDEARRVVPIIALTAHAQAGYRDVVTDAGMDGYVTKPIDRRALRSELLRVRSCAR